MDATNTHTSQIGPQMDADQKQDRCQQTHVQVGIAITMSIVIAVGVSDIVLLSISKCSFHIEIMPIILVIYFVISTTKKILIHKTHLPQEQHEPLLTRDDKHTEDGTSGGKTSHLRKWYTGKRVPAVVIMAGILDCFPITLCVLWIYVLCAHLDINDMHGNICEIRYWYSVAQTAFFTLLSLAGMTVGIRTVVTYLYKTRY